MFFLYFVILIFPNATLLLLPPANITIHYTHSVEKTYVVERLEARNTGMYLLHADYGGACGYGIPCGVGDATTSKYLGRSIAMYCHPVNMCAITTPVGDVAVAGTFVVGVVRLQIPLYGK